MRLLRFAVLAGLCVVLSAAAFADSITVNNPSFEDTAAGPLAYSCGNGDATCTWDFQAIPGWTTTGADGLFHPGASYFSSLPDGPTVAFSNGGTISQTVGTTVEAGVTYTLTVDMGNRSDTSATSFDGSVDLLVGGQIFNATGTEPAPGDWATYTAIFTGTSADAGDAITIQLNSSGTQGDFDDVQLSDNLGATVPEPSSLLMLGIGLLGLAVFGWRRRDAGVALG